MKLPEDFIENLPDPQLRETARFLHGFICSYPGMRSALKYGIPFYTGRTGICYLNPTRDGQLEWAFIKGCRMTNA